jgi:hypothetical protein
MKLSVEVRTTQVSGYFINVKCQWGLEKKIEGLVLLKFDEYYAPVVLTIISTPKTVVLNSSI